MLRLLKLILIACAILIANACNNDPCDDIICLNDGFCVNGACDCPTGFNGPSCADQITPSKISVTQVRVTKFPATDDNGAGWDLTSGADIFIRMSYNGTEIYESDIYYEDANPTFSYSYVPVGNLNLNATDRYVISLYDYDTLDPNDFMLGIEFFPYTADNRFPATLLLDAGAGVAFELDLLYTF